MKAFAKRLERYLADNGRTMPEMVSLANDANEAEEISITACVMSRILGVALSDCVDYVDECVADSDCIDLKEIEEYIKYFER